MFDSQMEIEMNVFAKRDAYSRKQTRSADYNSMETPNSNTASPDFPPTFITQQSGSHKKTVYKHIPHSEKPAHLVAKRNERERRRVQAVNSAFLRLRKHVPQEPRHKRLSKFKTLKVAIQYIKHMQDLIRAHDKQLALNQRNTSRCYDDKQLSLSQRNTSRCYHDKQLALNQRNTSRCYDDNEQNTRRCHVGSKMSSSPHTISDDTKDLDHNHYYKSMECGVTDSMKEQHLLPFQQPTGFPDHCFNPQNTPGGEQYQINEMEQLHCAPTSMFPVSDSFVTVSAMALTHTQSHTQCPVLSKTDFGFHGNQWIPPFKDNPLHQASSVLGLRTHSTTPDSISSLDSWNGHGVPRPLVYSMVAASTSDSLSSCSSNSTGVFSNY